MATVEDFESAARAALAPRFGGTVRRGGVRRGTGGGMTDILQAARAQVLDQGIGLSEPQALEVLQLPTIGSTSCSTSPTRCA